MLHCSLGTGKTLIALLLLVMWEDDSDTPTISFMFSNEPLYSRDVLAHANLGAQLPNLLGVNYVYLDMLDAPVTSVMKNIRGEDVIDFNTSMPLKVTNAHHDFHKS